MKAALIPPIAHLTEFCGQEDFHLVLAHLLDRPEYRSFYREQHLRGAFLVLDNGAHEQTAGEKMQDLLAKARVLRADEVVLPDTLFDREATVAGARSALEYLLTEGQQVWAGVYPSFMVVPQGMSFGDWQACLGELLAVYTEALRMRPDLFVARITIGVSKDYDFWEGGHKALLYYLAELRPWITFDVHLLGWARDLSVLGRLAVEMPWIRSTDSAKPFVYASDHLYLPLYDLSTAPAYPGRSPDYFDSTLTEEQVRIARHNIAQFKEAAHAEV